MARSPSPVRYRLVSGPRPGTTRSDSALRFGYGRDCELVLEGEGGPPVLFEVHATRGPLQIATRVPPEELASYVDLQVDGAPLDEPLRTLAPGSRIALEDKGTRQRYELVLEPPSRWHVRLRFLAAVVVALAVLGGLYAAYVYHALERTRGTLHTTTARVERAEQRVRETLERLASAEVRVGEALRALSAERRAADESLREELELRMDALGASALEALDQLSERDVEARAELRADLEQRVAGLREEFAARLVESYQRFKSLERDMLEALAARAAEAEPESARFKRVLGAARDAVLFIHTRYAIEFGGSEEPERQTFDTFGTGFVVDADGLALTAQHVLFPWRYERELILLTAIGAARIVETETRWAAWPTGRRVFDGDTPDGPLLGNAYASDAEPPTLRFLHAPEPTISEELAQTAFGLLRLEVPVPGASDVAVIRLSGHEGDLAHLPLAGGPVGVEPLDELLAVGYPLSRLVGGVAQPQAIRGLVRRLGPGMVEVDVPLHPGLSGAPLLDADGAVVGMASAIFGSTVYGIAAPRESLVEALRAARASVRPGAGGAHVVD